MHIIIKNKGSYKELGYAILENENLLSSNEGGLVANYHMHLDGNAVPLTKPEQLLHILSFIVGETNLDEYDSKPPLRVVSLSNVEDSLKFTAQFNLINDPRFIISEAFWRMVVFAANVVLHTPVGSAIKTFGLYDEHLLIPHRIIFSQYEKDKNIIRYSFRAFGNYNLVKPTKYDDNAWCCSTTLDVLSNCLLLNSLPVMKYRGGINSKLNVLIAEKGAMPDDIYKHPQHYFKTEVDSSTELLYADVLLDFDSGVASLIEPRIIGGF